MLSELPPELLDRIADNLHPPKCHRAECCSPILPTKGDLEAFSLVCQYMRSIGQPHLFRDVVYSFRCEPSETQGGLVPYVQPLEHRSNTRRCHTLQMLRTFFQDQPSLGSAVRRLKLVGGDDVAEREYITQSDSTSSNSYRVKISLFHHFLSLLPLLEELEFLNVELLSSRAYWTSRAAPLPSLQRLLIGYCDHEYQSVNQVVAILGCFDTIDEVLIRNLILIIDGLEAYDPTLCPSSARIRSFVFVGENYISEGLFDFLQRSPSLRSLDIASIIPMTGDVVLAELERLIHSVGPRLDHFGCTFPKRPKPYTGVLVDLSVCSALRSLTIRINLSDYPRPSRHAEVWQEVTQMIETCRKSALLRTITFEISVSSSNRPRVERWMVDLPRAVRTTEDALLDLARRGSLSLVRFGNTDERCASPSQQLTPSNVAQIRKSFARLEEKHMLVFM